MFTVLEKGYTKNGREIELRYNHDNSKLYIWQNNGNSRTTELYGTSDSIAGLWKDLTTVAPTNGQAQ